MSMGEFTPYIVRDRKSVDLAEGDYRYLVCKDGFVSVQFGTFTAWDSTFTKAYFDDREKFDRMYYLEPPKGMNPQEAIEEVHYRFECALVRENSPMERAHHLVELSDAVSNLVSWHEDYDTNTGTMPWEREDEEQ